MTSPGHHQAAGRSWATQVAAFVDRRSRFLIIGAVVFTVLLVLPLSLLDEPDAASQNPDGRVFDLQQRIDDTFAAPAHWIPFIAEARNGDMLTRQNLSELLLTETVLRSEDANGTLLPDGLGRDPALLSYFDNTTNRNVDGIVTIADAVEGNLRASSGGTVSLFEATEEQVKIAVHEVLADPNTRELVEFLSVNATSETRVTSNGREIVWWISPAIQFNVFADNERLGGGTQSIGISADDRTLDKEQFNRNVQEVLRRDVEGYRVWGVAIDANLESADEGEESGIFITFTVIAAIGVVGISLRSYWAVALTGVGLGTLMIWLKGISLLVGIKGGLVIDLIVPIAMVSLGVDFAVHAIRRYQEERRTIAIPRRALVIGLGAVLPALLLAMVSDSIAFLANSAAGIEAVVHFGFAASIATVSSFVVLGIIVPQAYARIDDLLNGRTYSGRRRLALIVFASFGVASAAGGSVILLIVLSPLAGTAFLAITLLVSIVLPTQYLARNRAESPEPSPEARSAQTAAGDHESHSFDRLAALTRYRFVVAGVVAGITALAAVYAVQLDATFDVKDFFSSESDFAVGLDKLDEHVGDRSGEAASVLIEGDLTDPTVLPAVQGVFDNLDGNMNLGRDTRGVVNITEPNLVQIVLDITASPAGRAGVLELTGVEIPENPPYGTPPEQDQIDAVLEYAVQAGVPTLDGDLKYTPSDVRSVLNHNPLGRTVGLTQFTVFIPGTREQSAVVRARDSIERDLTTLDSVSAITDFGVTGSPMIRQAQLEATTESLQRSIPIAGVAAFILLLVAFRSLRFAIVTIIPIGLVVVWLYAIMYISGFALNFVTATIGAVSIGVGIDFSIHLTQRFREELLTSPSRFAAMQRALRGTGVALAGSSASSIIGFAIMGLAPMPLFSSYGFLTSIMVFLAVLAALVVLPSLLLIVTPEPARRIRVRFDHWRQTTRMTQDSSNQSPTRSPHERTSSQNRRSGDPIISVSNLTKRYDDLLAVNDVSFEVHAGEVFGMLGPNGAGKTTTIEILEGMREADSGTAIVGGIDVRRDPKKVKSIIGVQLQTSSFFDYLSVAETVKLYGELYGERVDVDAILKEVELTDRGKAYFKQLSGGQKQRMSIAVALVNRPQVLFLDEPTTALDPQARRHMWDLIQRIRETGTTIMLTTHYMEEAEELCDRVAIMDSGQIIRLDTPDMLVEQLLDSGFKSTRKVKPATLEDVFIDLTGRSLREG